MALLIAAVVLALIFASVWWSGEESAGMAAYEWALLTAIFALAWFLSRRVKAWVERRRSQSS
jgi:hypothetical protein